MALISMSSVINELNAICCKDADILDILDEINDTIETYGLNEAEYNKATEHLRLDILDVERFVAVNDCKCVTNPRSFDSNSIPSRDGLLSNEIFGYTAEEKMGTFGYIDLHGWFIDPSCYKTWIRLDSKVKNIVHGIGTYSIDEKGQFVEDPEGETGLKFIYDNINHIQFKPPQSKSKDISYKYLQMNKDRMFIKKYMVIPVFYRDKNTSKGSQRTVGLGGINKIYTNLIVASQALTITQDYNFDASDAMVARVQEIILNIYDWFCGNRNKNNENNSGVGMSGKLGIMRRTVTSKTANFSSRLVLSAPELKTESVDDFDVTYDRSSIPLYSLMAEFRDFVMFHTRRFFENEFQGINTYPVMNKAGKTKTIIPETPEITFSDERIRREMDRFVHGYNNRFVPVEIPVEGTDEVYYMIFKGKYIDSETGEFKSMYRRLTWCDVFYLATVEATKDKHVLISRFPINKSVGSYSNI